MSDKKAFKLALPLRSWISLFFFLLKGQDSKFSHVFTQLFFLPQENRAISVTSLCTSLWLVWPGASSPQASMNYDGKFQEPPPDEDLYGLGIVPIFPLFIDWGWDS